MAASRGEMKVSEILKMHNFRFKTEYSFPDLISSSGRPLRFDFAVFDDDGNIDFLVEYQGIQHYQPVKRFGGKKGLYRQKYNDNRKRIYCAKNDYPLVAVPYWDDNILDLDYLLEKAGY